MTKLEPGEAADLTAKGEKQQLAECIGAKIMTECSNCKAEFEHLARKPRKYCSTQCSQAASRGRPCSWTRKHGLSAAPEHANWRNLRNRCRNPECKWWPSYVGRGITCCERWDDFANFYADMGPKPAPGYSIDRIDNNGNYEPGNCKWATPKEQSQNRRCVYTADEDARLKSAIDRKLNLNEIVEFVGRSKSSIRTRAYRLGLSFYAYPVDTYRYSC